MFAGNERFRSIPPGNPPMATVSPRGGTVERPPSPCPNRGRWAISNGTSVTFRPIASGSFLRQKPARTTTPRRFNGTASGCASSYSWKGDGNARIAVAMEVGFALRRYLEDHPLGVVLGADGLLQTGPNSYAAPTCRSSREGGFPVARCLPSGYGRSSQPWSLRCSHRATLRRRWSGR